jgi:hypothetical protein
MKSTPSILRNSLRKTLGCCAVLASAMLLSTGAMAQTKTPATIPSSKLGTYNVTMFHAQPGSPVANGATATIVVGPGGALCVAGMTLTNPMLLNGSNIEAHWEISSVKVSLALANLVADTTVFNVYEANTTGGTSASGLKLFGQFSGSRVSTSTTGCGTPVAPVVTTPDPTKVAQLFEEAQKKLAQYFPATTNAQTQTLDGYTYRFYPSTNIYLAINNGDIYVMGGQFGNTPIKQGPLEAILSELAKMPVSIPAIPSGNSTLVLTGTVGAMGFVTTIPSITIDNLPMPSASDIDNVRNAVRDQYKDSGITGTINVTLISSSSSRIVFNIKFNGSITQQGFTITQNYDITYTYTKK